MQPSFRSGFCLDCVSIVSRLCLDCVGGWGIISRKVRLMRSQPSFGRGGRGENRVCGRETVTISISWLRLLNFDHAVWYCIDRYDSRCTAHDNCTWPMCQHVLAVITVSENLNNVQRNTTSTATIAAVNQCGYYLYYYHSYMW